jgi:hypothetical protein
MNKGNHKKQIREFAKGLGLEKRFMRKIFEDENSKIKYKLKIESSFEPIGYDAFLGINRTEETFHTATIMDIYATSADEAIKIYDNLENLFNKIREKNGEKGLGTFIWGDPHFVKEEQN